MRSKYTIITENADQTIKLGEVIGRLAEEGSIVALIGELGSGKTVITKGIAKGLDIKEEPNSPTFVILNIYSGRIPLYHFDLYRLNTSEELEDIGFSEIISGKGVSVIEWADRIAGILPDNIIRVEFFAIHSDNNSFSEKRKIIIEGNSEWLLSFKNTAEQALLTLRR